MVTDFKFANLDPGKTTGDLWRASLPEDNKSVGYVNDKGVLVIPYPFARGSKIFKNGLAVVGLKEDDYPDAVINTKGEYVMPPDSSAGYQIVRIIRNIADDDSNYYNKYGQSIDFTDYEIHGIFQHLTLPSQ